MEILTIRCNKNLTNMAQVILLNNDTAVRAKVIAVRTSSRMVDGISKALLIEQLKRKLRSGQIVKFAYLKRMEASESLLVPRIQTL